MTPHIIRSDADSARILAEESPKISWNLRHVDAIHGHGMDVIGPAAKGARPVPVPPPGPAFFGPLGAEPMPGAPVPVPAPAPIPLPVPRPTLAPGLNNTTAAPALFPAGPPAAGPPPAGVPTLPPPAPAAGVTTAAGATAAPPLAIPAAPAKGYTMSEPPAPIAPTPPAPAPMPVPVTAKAKEGQPWSVFPR